MNLIMPWKSTQQHGFCSLCCSWVATLSNRHGVLQVQLPPASCQNKLHFQRCLKHQMHLTQQQHHPAHLQVPPQTRVLRKTVKHPSHCLAWALLYNQLHSALALHHHQLHPVFAATALLVQMQLQSKHSLSVLAVSHLALCRHHLATTNSQLPA